MAKTWLIEIILLSFIALKVVANGLEDDNEKLVKVWEDRIQHTDLDADEVNFPLFLHEDEPNNNAGKEGSQNTTSIDKIDDDIESDNDFSDHATDNNSSIITFFHKITSNNVTRQGVTQIPSSSVLPLIKTALSSVSGENALLLALGGLLPLLMMALPFAIMSVVIPMFLVIGFTMFGVVASSFFFMPLALFGFGLYAATDFNFLSDKASSLNNFSAFEDFPSFEELETIGEKISQAMENITVAEEELPFQTNNNNVPRLFF